MRRRRHPSLIKIEKRHYCSVCRKKRIESQMKKIPYDAAILLSLNTQGKQKWRCIDCTVENRRYGLPAEQHK